MKFEMKKQAGEHLNFHKQKGASLLEGIAYLGIAALVVLGAVSLLSNASASAKANQTMEELVSLRTAVKKLYVGQGFGAAGTNLVPTLITARAVPATLTTTGNALTNSWSGAVTVQATANGFSIVYNDVPQDVCVNALSGASGWVSVSSGAANSNTTAFPVSTARAAIICADAGSNNDITFQAN